MSLETVAAKIEETNGELDIEILPVFVPERKVYIESKAGVKQLYMVGESDGGKAYWEWLERLDMLIESKVPQKGTVWSEVQADLIVQCLTLDGQKVPKETVMSWGKAIKQRLYDIAMEMNGNKKAIADAVGKDSGDAATTGGGSASPKS